jgi:hypothetical protein
MSKIDRQETRQGRVPVASNRAPLAVKGFDHDNFAGRWVDDRDDRLAMYLEAGYEFVPDTVKESHGDKTVDSSSGLDSRKKKPGGKGKTLYLMRLPRELYNEDQLAKQREIDLMERAMASPGSGSTVEDGVDYGQVSLGHQAGNEKVQFRKIRKQT